MRYFIYVLDQSHGLPGGLVQALKEFFTFKKKTFADNLLTPMSFQDVHVFLSSVEKKLRFLMKTF